jgi:hypothetical protein
MLAGMGIDAPCQTARLARINTQIGAPDAPPVMALRTGMTPHQA